jgi:zinc protease
VWLYGGARTEEIPGQALVTGRLLAEGTRRRDWRRIVQESEDRGMVLQSFGSYEAVGVAIDALFEDWERVLADLAELVLEPSFPEDRCDWIRRQAQGELESLYDQPASRTGRAYLADLYPGHPYGRPLQGDAASLSRLTVEDCAAFHRRCLGWGVLAVVTGEIDEDAVARRLDELFAVLDSPGENVPTPVAPTRRGGARSTLQVGDSDQAHLYGGHLTVPRGHPDLPALSTLGVALGAGAGLTGRFPDRIREKEGLAYSVDVSTCSGAGLDPGRFSLYVGTSPETVEAAERALREELERLLAHGLTDEEMESARSFLLGRDPFRRETARQWADVLAEAEFYGLQSDRPEWVRETLGALRREDVEAAARRWLSPDELRLTVGLPG